MSGLICFRELKTEEPSIFVIVKVRIVLLEAEVCRLENLHTSNAMKAFRTPRRDVRVISKFGAEQFWETTNHRVIGELNHRTRRERNISAHA